MNLYTPELTDFDSVFPSENWFFYWKTTSSLWRSKASEYNAHQLIFLPINWGMHTDRPNEFDFAKYRPETNLVKLIDLFTSLGKKVVLVLPLGPSPFLPNGGVPTYLARTPSVSKNGINMCTVDFEGRLNKFYSYFDPRVFQNFRKFLFVLKNYLYDGRCNPDIIIADYGYCEEGSFQSYFDDRSRVFYEGLDRFLKTGGKQNEEFSTNAQLVEQRYASEIKNLYRQSIHEILNQNLVGETQITYIGGSEKDVFARSSDLWENENNYFESLFELLSYDYLPVSTLIKPELRTNVFKKCLSDIVTDTFVKNKISYNLYEGNDFHFDRLNFFSILNFSQPGKTPVSHSDTGLISYLTHWFKYGYQMKSGADYEFESEEDHSILILRGEEVDAKSFNKIIKSFLSGRSVLIDTTNMSEDVQQKFKIFFIENSIETEKIKFTTNVEKAVLGEGKIILYDGSLLVKSALSARRSFWENIVKFFDIHFVNIQADEDIYFYWRSRSSSSFELNYEEIRRVNLYNPTSYNKKAHLFTNKNFVFIKTIDVIDSEVSTSPLGVEVNLSPGGSMALDFGFFEN